MFKSQNCLILKYSYFKIINTQKRNKKNRKNKRKRITCCLMGRSPAEPRERAGARRACPVPQRAVYRSTRRRSSEQQVLVQSEVRPTGARGRPRRPAKRPGPRNQLAPRCVVWPLLGLGGEKKASAGLYSGGPRS